MPSAQSVDDVFGVTRDIPLNYVERVGVDDKMVDCLARAKHIVIFGSSKQGKTSLRKRTLLDRDYVVISAQNKWDISQLHAAILKECGFKVTQSTERTVSGEAKITVQLEGKAGIPFIGSGRVEADAEAAAGAENTVTVTPLELDPADPNDVIRALAEINFSRFIVIEDFHYLPDDTQRAFSFSLKAFHEKSKLSFIIVGVWREENRLIGMNGDLTDRVLSVDVDDWGNESLRKVIGEGANILNIEFDDQFISAVLEKSFDSVHIVQEVCRRACRDDNVIRTQTNKTTVGVNADVSKLVSAVVSEQAARYQGFLQNFSEGFQATDLEMPKWIIYALLCVPVEKLEKGIRLTKLSRMVKLKHPRGNSLNNGNITQILNSASSLQNKKGIRPLVIDYDAANTTLSLVDKGFLIWLANQDVEELLEELELPSKLSSEELSELGI